MTRVSTHPPHPPGPPGPAGPDTLPFTAPDLAVGNGGDIAATTDHRGVPTAA